MGKQQQQWKKRRNSTWWTRPPAIWCMQWVRCVEWKHGEKESEKEWDWQAKSKKKANKTNTRGKKNKNTLGTLRDFGQSDSMWCLGNTTRVNLWVELHVSLWHHGKVKVRWVWGDGGEIHCSNGYSMFHGPYLMIWQMVLSHWLRCHAAEGGCWEKNRLTDEKGGGIGQRHAPKKVFSRIWCKVDDHSGKSESS